ncbi:tetratricopeptide repeat protein [Amphritea balenae]|nr:tetratricopeptide repeat protein [Amphritea balenae]GGK59216.1 hypothetical protein GCM10007941_06810 [Amphritea balenae]
MTIKTALPFCKILISAGLTMILGGCASNQINNDVSAQQSEYYQGKEILPFLAEQQAKSPEEAIQNADQAMSVNDSDRALFNYIRAYELDDQHSYALLRIGDIHYNRNNLAISYQAYQQALKLDPKLGEAYKGSGMILLHNKSYSMATTSFTQAIEYLQEQPEKQKPLLDSYIGLGIINDITGQHIQAEQNYKAAIKLDPKSPRVQTNLGYSYYMQEKWVNAESAFNKALQSDNSYSPAWKNLGLTYARQERYNEAIGALEQVMPISEAYNDIGYICMITQRYEMAALFLRKAIKEHPQYYTVAQQNLTRVKRLLASNPDGRSKL